MFVSSVKHTFDELTPQLSTSFLQCAESRAPPVETPSLGTRTSPAYVCQVDKARRLAALKQTNRASLRLTPCRPAQQDARSGLS